MAWQRIGTVTVGPDDDEVIVGPIQVPFTGGVRVRIRQTSPTPFQWGYGLLSFRSSQGRELGTIRVWPKPELTAYHLGDALSVTDRSGVLIFEPRTWSLRWVKAGFSLGLDVLADVATDLPDDRFTSEGFGTAAGADLPVSPSGILGRLRFLFQ